MRAVRERLAKAKDLHSLESLASAWLPIEALRDLASLPLKRIRWLPLTLVFWACLNMVFHPGSSCRESQRSIQAWWKRRKCNWRNPCSSAFCGARARLPLGWLRSLWWLAADRLAAAAPTLPGCHGRRVLVVDGTSLTTPDTYDNQQAWPQPGSQKPGCGFPIINLAGIFCLGSGALLRAAHGKWKTSEAAAHGTSGGRATGEMKPTSLPSCAAACAGVISSSPIAASGALPTWPSYPCAEPT